VGSRRWAKQDFFFSFLPPVAQGIEQTGPSKLEFPAGSNNSFFFPLLFPSFPFSVDDDQPAQQRVHGVDKFPSSLLSLSFVICEAVRIGLSDWGNRPPPPPPPPPPSRRPLPGGDDSVFFPGRIPGTIFFSFFFLCFPKKNGRKKTSAGENLLLAAFPTLFLSPLPVHGSGSHHRRKVFLFPLRPTKFCVERGSEFFFPPPHTISRSFSVAKF